MIHLMSYVERVKHDKLRREADGATQAAAAV